MIPEEIRLAQRKAAWVIHFIHFFLFENITSDRKARERKAGRNVRGGHGPCSVIKRQIRSDPPVDHEAGILAWREGSTRTPELCPRSSASTGSCLSWILSMNSLLILPSPDPKVFSGIGCSLSLLSATWNSPALLPPPDSHLLWLPHPLPHLASGTAGHVSFLTSAHSFLPRLLLFFSLFIYLFF